MSEIALSCRCGTLGGVLHHGAGAGSRVLCYCRDCQTGAHALGAGDLLDARGGSAIFQTIPARVEITSGRDRLACLRLSPKGLMRWYAACCDTPLFNTLGTPRLCFVGVLEHAVAPGARDHLGPLVSVANTGGARPGEPAPKPRGVALAGFNIVSRHFAALLRGRRTTPFFKADGSAVVAPRVLSLDERRAATPPHLAG
ncbi:DUF6151 family protein [Shimia sp.]|uniref:DUF6151 family protein n=1 Tax=Shimia sp. TaxID=1954381 RepID=UPI00356B0C4C